MFWKFPIKVPTLQDGEKTYTTFNTQEEMIEYMWKQFKLPGE